MNLERANEELKKSNYKLERNQSIFTNQVRATCKRLVKTEHLPISAYLGITVEARKKARELDIEYPSSSDDSDIALKKQRTGDPAD